MKPTLKLWMMIDDENVLQSHFEAAKCDLKRR